MLSMSFYGVINLTLGSYDGNGYLHYDGLVWIILPRVTFKGVI